MRAWPIVVIAAVLPLWLVGLFGRVYWTPDEPREADIAWHMTSQPDKSVPELAGKPFAEKPPLAYWIAAASMSAFGPTPGAARLPNLLYAVISVLAIGALANAARGRQAAVIAGVAAASFLLAYQVSIWLATDAPLVAGVSVALLGLYRGLAADRGRAKFAWYTLMHLGMLGGFLAKSAVAWMVPGLAFLVLILWERRWHELKCWELYAGLLLQFAGIALWIWNVAQRSDGSELLRALFWYNLIGRFMTVQAPAAYEYTSGHHNWLGKYLMQAPGFLAPWTLLAVAAGRYAYLRLRTGIAGDLPWKFALAVIVPSALLLSSSATARGIYLAPVLPAVGLLIGLWASERLSAPDRAEMGLLRASAWLVIGVIGMAAMVTLLMIVGARGSTGFHTLGAVGAIAGCLGAAALVVAARRRMNSGAPYAGLVRLYVAYAVLVTGAGAFLFPIISGWQDLRQVAAEVHDHIGSSHLVLYQPDETTIAMLDYDSSGPPPVGISGTDEGAAQAQVRALLASDASLHVLVQLPGHAPGPFTDALHRWHLAPGARDPLPASSAARLCAALGLSVQQEIELPEGRRYVLLARNPSEAGVL
jgi:4-amino-4-deoxy-L-arabinose transferase-like glycosyltransferase